MVLKYLNSSSARMPPPLLTPVEIAKHSSERDCWLLIENEVWDLTEFAPRHPGGAETILRYAGKNASKAYSQIHPPSLLSTSLPSSALKGKLNTTSSASDPLLIPIEPAANHSPSPDPSSKPPLNTLISTHDFALAAERTATPKTWAFYSSAATNTVTRDLNSSIYDRIWFRPRVMRDVADVDTSTSILGTRSSVPFFVSPAAMVGLIHPGGAEGEIARGCASRGVIQSISTSATLPLNSITTSTHPTHPTHPFFFQLYVSKNRSQTLSLLHSIRQNPQIRALMITADAAWPGKREADERVSSSSSMKSSISGTSGSNDSFGGGLARHMSSFIDSGLNWEYISWIRDAVGPEIPLVLKGVQSAADVQLAIKYGFQAVLLSNHGGRNLDTSPPAVITLLECHARCPEVFGKIEILVDGGVRRGSDIIKMLCLGASGVGLGRPFLYAANYGQEGVERVIDILSDELRTTMRNLGIKDLSPSTLSPEYVHTGDIEHLVPKTRGHPYAKAWWNELEKEGVRAKL